jgi:hypothetical protein
MNRYYAATRERLWPILLFKIAKTQEIESQTESHLRLLRDTARRLIKLPTLDAPKTLTKHVQDWGKLLQRQANFYEESLRRREWDQPEASTSSFIGQLIGFVFEINKPAPKPKPGLAVFQKEAIKLSDEAARMEAILERLGAELLENFQPALYAWFNVWTGQDHKVPADSGMVTSPEQLETLLTKLPGGKQLSSFDLYRSSEESLTIVGSISEGFVFQRLNAAGSTFEFSTTEDYPLADSRRPSPLRPAFSKTKRIGMLRSSGSQTRLPHKHRTGYRIRCSVRPEAKKAFVDYQGLLDFHMKVPTRRWPNPPQLITRIRRKK